MRKVNYLFCLTFVKAGDVLAANSSMSLGSEDNPGSKLPTDMLGKDGIITKISNTLLLLVGVVAVLFLIIGGFQYITSAGNPESVGKAKNTILYAIIGIGAVLLSYAAVQFILTNIGKK